MRAAIPHEEGLSILAKGVIAGNRSALLADQLDDELLGGTTGALAGRQVVLALRQLVVPGATPFPRQVWPLHPGLFIDKSSTL